LLDPHTDPKRSEFVHEKDPGEALSFLDRCLQQRGPRSVAYISFGSLIWPPTKEETEILLDVLDKLDICFLIAAGISEPEIRRVVDAGVSKSGGRGLAAGWVPQGAVLQHQVRQGIARMEG